MESGREMGNRISIITVADYQPGHSVNGDERPYRLDNGVWVDKLFLQSLLMKAMNDMLENAEPGDYMRFLSEARGQVRATPDKPAALEEIGENHAATNRDGH
jgi:hypothetical protein